MWKLSLIVSMLLAATASAETVYLPVQFEYGSGAEKFYYGGNDPAVFARADRATQAMNIVNRNRPTLAIRTYTDALPYAANAALFGFTANDARNEAYQSVPRYFRMSDVRPESPAPDAKPMIAEVTSTRRGTIEIKPYVRPGNKPVR